MPDNEIKQLYPHVLRDRFGLFMIGFYCGIGVFSLFLRIIAPPAAHSFLNLLLGASAFGAAFMWVLKHVAQKKIAEISRQLEQQQQEEKRNG